MGELPQTTELLRDVDLTALITAMVAVMALVLSSWQFFKTRSDANKAPFLTKQLELVFRASEAVSTLATSRDPEAWERARSDFWILYWGPLSIVENQSVLNAMADLGDIVPRNPIALGQIPVLKGIEHQSFNLAILIRRLMLESWHVDLPNLKDRARN